MYCRFFRGVNLQRKYLSDVLSLSLFLLQLVFREVSHAGQWDREG